MFKRNSQRGFTLIEILVALAILAVLSVLAASAFDGSRTKAQTMIGLARSVADANIQLKNDTGCYVNNPSALFNPTAAQVTANNYCGATFGNSWSRPYLAKYPVNSTGNLQVDKISSGVTTSLGQLVDSSGTNYYVEFSGVPIDVIKQALIECNSTDKVQGDFVTYRCRTAADLSSQAPGTFDMLYDTTH